VIPTSYVIPLRSQEVEVSDFQKSKGQAINPRERNFSAGFSLVELMVAMVIGLLAIIVMMQMFSVFEEQKRTTTGGDDALSSGAIALNSMQQDIEQAGWGLSSVRVLGCNITGWRLRQFPWCRSRLTQLGSWRTLILIP